MAIRTIQLGSFGPFEYDDLEFPRAFDTDGDFRASGTIEGNKLSVDEIVSEVRLKPGGSITNDTGTYVIDDTKVELIDADTKVFLDADGLEVEDLVSNVKTIVGTNNIRHEDFAGGFNTGLGVNSIVGFCYLAFDDLSGNPFRMIGGVYRVYDTTDTTGAGTGAFQVDGGVRVDKGLSVGKTVDIGEQVQLKGIKVVQSADLPYTIEPEYSVFRINDTSTVADPIELPAATGSGRVIVIKDTAGTFDTAAITLSIAGGVGSIDGNSTLTLNLFKQSIMLMDVASGEWQILSNVGF